MTKWLNLYKYQILLTLRRISLENGFDKLIKQRFSDIYDRMNHLSKQLNHHSFNKNVSKSANSIQF